MAESGGGSRTGAAAAALGALALLLAFATLWLGHGNRALQQQAADAQQQVAKAQAMANLDNNLVQMLAKAAVENNDAALRSLLDRNGVQLKTTPGAPAPAGATDHGQ